MPKIPKKYVAGSKNPKKTIAEIKRTRKKYKEGKLTKKEMDEISKQRVASGKKKAQKPQCLINTLSLAVSQGQSWQRFIREV